MPVPPKHPSERRRRNATVPMTQLPAGGRKGPTPKWPLEVGSPRELHWWEEFWTTPQAAAWEKFNLYRTVARYCHVFALFEMGANQPHIWAECRQLEDRLGLNPLAMLRLRWEVSDDALGEKRSERTATRPRVVDPGAVAGS